MRRAALWMTVLLLGAGCIPETAPAEEEELCQCVRDENGKWNMQLSDACVELCVEKFGPELVGMEEWFVEHCGYGEERPPAPKTVTTGTR